MADRIEFRNETPYKFIDIDSEEYRVYIFKGGDNYMIKGPLKLHVSESGGHRIFDDRGNSHYIPKGWIGLRWKAKKGKPHFVA